MVPLKLGESLPINEPLRSTFLQIFEALVVQIAETIGTAGDSYLVDLQRFYRSDRRRLPLSFEDLGWPEVSMEYNSENMADGNTSFMIFLFLLLAMRGKAM
jgi:hypothetical protein